VDKQRLATSIGGSLIAVAALVCLLAAENYFVLKVSAWDIDWRSLLAMFAVMVVGSLIPRPPWLVWCLTGALAGFGCWTLASAIFMRHKIVNAAEIWLFCFAPLVIVLVWRIRHERLP